MIARELRVGLAIGEYVGKSAVFVRSMIDDLGLKCAAGLDLSTDLSVKSINGSAEGAYPLPVASISLIPFGDQSGSALPNLSLGFQLGRLPSIQ